MDKQKFKENFAKFHDRNYKLLLLIPLILIVSSVIYMGYFYNQTGDFIHKDVSLAGGTSATINDGNINSVELKEYLSSKLDDVNIREISDLTTGKQIAVIVETQSDGDYAKKILEEYLGYELNDTNSSFEFTGASLSGTFYQQLLVAILIAFVLMSLVVFAQFKSLIPSLAVIYSAFADVFMSLVVMNLLGIRISSAGIVAFLMLIGYSVDTDILLTNRVLKGKEGSINSRIFESFKTGITMTLTSLFAVLAALLIVGSFSSTLFQIFLIMVLGLVFDLVNTWVTNVSIIKWYALSKQKKQNEN